MKSNTLVAFAKAWADHGSGYAFSLVHQKISGRMGSKERKPSALPKNFRLSPEQSPRLLEPADLPHPHALLNASANTDLDPLALSIAVHVHVFYPDQLGQIFHQLLNIQAPFDLFISTDTRVKKQQIECVNLSSIPSCRSVEIDITPNRGRDLAPMFVHFAPQLQKKDLCLHFHTKRSPYGKKTAGWADHLYKGILHSPQQVAMILNEFSTDQNLGLVMPTAFHSLVPFAKWGAAREVAEQLLARGGDALVSKRALEIPLFFPMGSFFWARSDDLKPLFDLDLNWYDFPQEASQTDGTTAHAIERLIGTIILSLNKKIKTV